MGEPASGTIEGVRNLGLRVPDDLHEWLLAVATRERRSLNSQVIVLLERVRAEMEREDAQ
jgi:hypothetical protein